MHLTMLLGSHDRDLGFIAVGISSALGSIFFCQHYAYLLLHSLNYYHMICNPLQFDQYSKGVNILKRICFLLALSFLLSTASFVELVTLLVGNNVINSKYSAVQINPITSYETITLLFLSGF